jgi:hypothetical protein
MIKARKFQRSFTIAKSISIGNYGRHSNLEGTRFGIRIDANRICIDIFLGDLLMKLIRGQSKIQRTQAALVALAALLVTAIAGCSSQQINKPGTQDSNMHASSQPATQEGKTKLGPPGAIAAEHREIHEQLEAALKAGGKTGDAAKVVEEKLSEHFKKEEEYALPQLGLLADLAEGRTSPEANKAIELSDKLKSEMPRMLQEHKGIIEALEALEKAATEEKNQQALGFVEKLRAHAETEEQVMYPTAILVGEYLKLRAGR